MTPLSQVDDSLNRKTEEKKPETAEEGQLRYWTNDMCTKSPHLFDFVITVRLSLISALLPNPDV